MCRYFPELYFYVFIFYTVGHRNTCHSIFDYNSGVFLIDLKQVAQLWQRDRTKLDTFVINVQRYSHNDA